MSQNPVYLHILWHQHQPWYVKPGTHESVMPWVRLHGVKDYYDIAWLSREFEGWKQTINLVPSLLEQIQRYTEGTLTDEYWELSHKAAEELTPDEKKQVLERFFDAHAPRMIHPFPRYDELFRKRGRQADDAASRFSAQDIRDLQVWHNLCWIDPIWRNNPEYPLRELMKKQRGFTESEKQQVLDIQRIILKQIIPLHKQLHKENRIHITCTPYYHPILPLLCDTDIARRSNPHDPVPDPHFSYPEDAVWHIREGINAFERIMGFRPTGMWPSEGSVSDAACSLIAQEKITFFCTDEGILFRSSFFKEGAAADRNELYRLHRLTTPNGELDCAFRDHGLSDLIGFVYQNRDPKEAAQDFLSHLKNIGTHWQGKNPPLVSVILDGENCWEFYPNDGHDFLHYWIEEILNDPQIIPTTLLEYRQQYPAQPTLKSIHPGSWINANYRIWIGHAEDNAAWHLLRQARETLTTKQDSLTETVRKEAWEMLHIAEGSDWFWWFGDINSSEHDLLFDYLFRSHLIHLYEVIGTTVPETLKRPIKQPKKVLKAGGILFRKTDVSGSRTGYYEWVGTKAVSVTGGGGAMHQATEVEADIRYGRLNKTLSLYVQFKTNGSLKKPCTIRLHITNPVMKTIELTRPGSKCVFSQTEHSLEAIVDLQEAGIEEQQEAWFFLEFEPDKSPSFALPPGSELYLQGLNAANASLYWFL